MDHQQWKSTYTCPHCGEEHSSHDTLIWCSLEIKEYFHGTTDLFLDSILEKGLLPPKVTRKLTEKRKDNKDIVFLTDSPLAAEGYAIRAAHKFGGNPVVLTVRAVGRLERKGRVNQFFTKGSSTLVKVQEVKDSSLERMVDIFAEGFRNVNSD